MWTPTPISASRFFYSLKDGINDGYLTPFRVKQISTTLDEYIYVPDDQVVEGEIEAGKVYEEPDFNGKQQVFLDFVLAHYVTIGVEELDQAKLNPLLRLKYHDSLADAVTDLGRPEEIGRVLSGFQQYLYQQQVTV